MRIRRTRSSFPPGLLGNERTAMATSEVETRPEPDEATIEEAPQRKRGRLGIFKRAIGNANRDHITNLAAALAYYAFLAIPAALLVVVGLFGLLASPHDVTTVVDKIGSVIPGEAKNLLENSLRRMTQKHGTGVAIIGVGGVLALWSLSGAMQNLMWALNAVYGREESRGFIRRRLHAFVLVFFAVLAFALMFGVLILGPALSRWLGSAVGERTVVHAAWWVAEWPLLVIWLAGSGAFAFYVSQFGSYNKTWGALAAVVILLTWLWLSAVALLFGAEIDAEADRGAPTLGLDDGVRSAGARGERGVRGAGELSESGSRAGRDGQRRADGDVPDHEPA
jgi:membrane protein